MQLLLNKQRFERMAAQFFLKMKNHQYDEAMQWASISAACAWHAHPGFYVHKEIERSLNKLYENMQLIKIYYPWSLPGAQSDGRRWLHVLTTAYMTGGHTRFAERWMRSTEADDVHSFILLDQEGLPMPNWLIEASKMTGGAYIVLPEEMNALQKAKTLNEVANKWADVVVLHIHPDDPISLVAFGSPGGPPVICADHASQAFWLGAGISDAVVAGRTEDRNLALIRRNIRQSSFLPLPLNVRPLSLSKNDYKSMLGISKNSVVLLTIADSYKFYPYKHLDFPKILTDIIKKNSKAILLVVGPNASEPIWKKAIDETEGRIKVLGVQSDIVNFYGAADLFIESFPFCSFTAAYDAALLGIPVITAPMPINPFLALGKYEGMDDNAESIEKYEALVQKYITDQDYRNAIGEIQRNSVQSSHTSDGWKVHLRNMLDSLPTTHDVGFINRTEESIAFHSFDEDWAEMQGRQGTFNILMYKFQRFLSKHP